MVLSQTIENRFPRQSHCRTRTSTGFSIHNPQPFQAHRYSKRMVGGIAFNEEHVPTVIDLLVVCVTDFIVLLVCASYPASFWRTGLAAHPLALDLRAGARTADTPTPVAAGLQPKHGDSTRGESGNGAPYI